MKAVICIVTAGTTHPKKQGRKPQIQSTGNVLIMKAKGCAVSGVYFVARSTWVPCLRSIMKASYTVRGDLVSGVVVLTSFVI